MPVQLIPGEDLTAHVREAFVAVFGHQPAAVAKAPGRVNLIGEHTDYHGGLCLPIALPHATWAAVRGRDDTAVRLVSTWGGEWHGTLGERPEGWASYVLGALRAIGHRGGLEVLVDSTVPVGAGLSSSAALICAVALATSSAPVEELVAPCVRAESEEVGAPTGGLDQTVALLGAAGHALLLDFASGARQQVPWEPGRAGLELLVVDTRTRHEHAAGGYADRRRESEKALAARADELSPLHHRRLRHVVSENARVSALVAALHGGDWPRVGALMTASHESLRHDFEVSCAELDVVVDTALAHGALGARMTGGGFGGCAIVLCPVSLRDAALAGISTAYAGHGWPQPAALLATASAAATRL